MVIKMAATQKLSEDRAVEILRNSLLVAGEEMGAGDHWPVIKKTIFDIMKTHEDLKIERNVQEELKKYLMADLREMEKKLEKSTNEEKGEIEPLLKELRDVYEAYFEPVEDTDEAIDEKEFPPYLKRAVAIIETLEADHE